MDVKEVEKLTNDWKTVSWKVIALEDPGVDELRRLFKETYVIINLYNKEDNVPKEIAALLLEIHDFGWWISDLIITPIHYLYQNIVSSVHDIITCFFTGESNIEEIDKYLNDKLM